MDLSVIVAIIAILQYLVFGVLVGVARGRHGVKAPATTGPEAFERANRVHMNTLEQLVAFVPALLLASQYWSDGLVALVGVVYLVGRIVFWRAYMANPASREIGFALTILPTALLLVAALVGAMMG